MYNGGAVDLLHRGICAEWASCESSENNQGRASDRSFPFPLPILIPILVFPFAIVAALVLLGLSFNTTQKHRSNTPYPMLAGCPVFFVMPSRRS